jgi:hypothetical protein
MRKTTIEIFNESYIIDSKTGCWLYQKTRKDGYGELRINNKKIKAHRFSYETFIGPLDPELEICHSCNCKSCVRPDHLRQDTRSSNQIDRVYDGNNSNQKLTPKQVAEIKIALKNSYHGINKYLASIYDVTTTTITDIKKQKTWSHLTID